MGERLRVRRTVGESGTDLPAQDDSKQWDQLLGAGARKKTRCSVCTRPLEDSMVAAAAFLCSSCTPSSQMKTNTSLPDHSKMLPPPGVWFTEAKQRSLTPSTNADSDDLDDSIHETTRCENALPKKTRCSEATRLTTTKAGQTRDIEAEVILEVRKQLRSPGNQGFVWIDAWNDKYLHSLGPLRRFLEKHPDEFVIKPLNGKGYRVAEAGRARRQNSGR